MELTVYDYDYIDEMLTRAYDYGDSPCGLYPDEYDWVKDAVGRQIARKPEIVHNGNYIIRLCPRCEKYLWSGMKSPRISLRYCDMCGQKIDWSEE